MRQYESYIQIRIIEKNIKVKKKKKENGSGGRGRKRVEREREKIFFFLSLLLSKIYGNRTIGFCQSKRQSQSTHRELHVVTKILAFHQTPRGREFSYLRYFYHKGHLMAWDWLRGHERP